MRMFYNSHVSFRDLIVAFSSVLAISQSEPSSRTYITVLLTTYVVVLVSVVMKPPELLNKVATYLSSLASLYHSFSQLIRCQLIGAQREK